MLNKISLKKYLYLLKNIFRTFYQLKTILLSEKLKKKSASALCTCPTAISTLFIAI